MTLRIGTCSFTAAGWEKTFYPPRLKASERLSYYATKFDTVEIDSSFYGAPAPGTVRSWYEKTPEHFRFALKMPQSITHERCLIDVEQELNLFLSNISPLGEKLGAVLIQFPYFRREMFEGPAPFLKRLSRFLPLLPDELPFALEIRNKQWIDRALLDVISERSIPLALIDHPWMYLPPALDRLVPTGAFSYIRLLGDRREIEERTLSWHEEVVDRSREIRSWVDVAHRRSRAGETVHVYVNNHYSGHAPAAVRAFLQQWDARAAESED